MREITTNPGREHPWIWLGAAVAVVGAVARIHNAWAFPAFWDFDGAGQALHVFDWYDGRLPHPRSWSGFHPPLYYLLGAGLWHVLPGGVPVHAALRLLSAAFGAGAVLIVWRELARCAPPADAALVALLAWCIPFVAVATSMTGNETLCALLVTALLARTTRLPRGDAELPRHALTSGLLGGAALLSKSTALIALGASLLPYLARLRGDPLRSLRVGAIVAVSALGLAAPHYARIISELGSPLAAVSAAAGSPEVKAVMAQQPPGERSLGDYLTVPPATLLEPVYTAPGLTRSVPGLLYASVWADGHAQFLPGHDASVLRAGATLSVLGLLPTALLALGAWRILRHPRQHGAWLAPLVFAAVLVLAFLSYTWRYPTYSAVKASYLIPALLPFAYVTTQGLLGSRGWGRSVLRAALLAVSLAATALTWWGWWL